MPTKQVLTFIGKSYAKKGFKFLYDGKNPSCPSNCRLIGACQDNLEKGQVYEVIQVMPKEHTCPHDLHEEDMILCKVAIPDLVVSMENKVIFEGSVVSYAPMNCDLVSCPNFNLCVPDITISKNERIRVVERLEKIKDCPKGYQISKVKVEKKK
jgi:uncharacterized protein (UPF0179 family)